MNQKKSQKHPHNSLPLVATFGALIVGALPASSAESFNSPNSPNLPARRLDSVPRRMQPATPPRPNATDPAAKFPQEFRPITGEGTNRLQPDWGKPETPFVRLAPPAYADGKDTPAGPTRPSARAISNIVVAQPELIANRMGASAMLWQWGQFLDHDLDLSPVASPEEPFDVPVPAGDASFDPSGTGDAVIALDRTLYTYVNGVRQQINDLTAFIDGSQVYGSDEVRATALRALDGTGRLKTSDGNLLPFNTAGLPNAPASPEFFLAGDFRVNEQVGLTAMHTLFVREHNYWADRIQAQNPAFKDDQIYQLARAIVGAELQAVTYREFLPVLLGRDALRPYRGYHPTVNPGIANEFATAAFRVGHTMLAPTLLRLNADGTPHDAGELSLISAFFNPGEILERGIEPVLSGLTVQLAQEVDSYIVDEVRNFLFGAPGSPGFDLASLNIQRGRDHGLPSYTQMRRAMGLRPVAKFADITPDKTTRANLASAYANVNDIDLWVGGLAEPHVPGAMVGETFRAILRDQFERTRDGDRFWYQSYLPPDLVRTVEQQTLSVIIRRNAATDWLIAPDAFHSPNVPVTRPPRR